MADQNAPIAPPIASNTQFKPGDPIPAEATGAPLNQGTPTYKQGDPIPEGATTQGVVPGEEGKSFNAEDTLSPEQNLALGATKGLGQTIATANKVANYIAPNFMHPVGNDERVQKLEQMAQPVNSAQVAGATLEGIAEFFVGDEALKGLSLADKLGLAQKLAKLAKDHPVVAKIIGHGLQAVRQGATAGGQALAHGATPTEALTTGATAAGLGTTVGAISEGIGAGVNKYQGLKATAAKTAQELQPEFQQGIKDIVDQVATEEGVAKSTASSIREYVEKTADNVEKKATDALKEIDNAAGEPFIQKFRQRLSNIRREINSLPEAGGGQREAELELEKQGVMEDMQKSYDQARANGIQDPENQLNEGLQTFKKAQALYDLDKELKRPSVTKGLQPNFGTAAQSAANPETVKPSLFFDRLQQMHGKGRLQEALGDDRARNLILHTSDMMDASKQLELESLLAKGKIDEAKSFVKKAVTAAGVGGIGTAAGSLVYNAMK